MKVVAFGDSLTQGNVLGDGIKNWTTIVSEQLNVEVINSGIGGNTTQQAIERLQTDVLDHRPDVVLIAFGMNDHVLYQGESLVDISNFRENMLYIVEEVRKIEAIPVFITPNYIIEGNDTDYYYSRHCKKEYDRFGGATELLDKYAEVVRDISKAESVALIDIRKECEKYNPYDFLRTKENSGASDGVHPCEFGVSVYANLIINYLKKL